MKLRADLAAMIVAGLTVVAITALAMTGRAIPEVLTTVALIVVGGGIGIAAPSLGANSTSSGPSTEDVVATLAGQLEQLLTHAEASTGAAQDAASAAIRAARAAQGGQATPSVPSQPTPSSSPATGYAYAPATSSGATS